MKTELLNITEPMAIFEDSYELNSLNSFINLSRPAENLNYCSRSCQHSLSTM